MKKRYYAENHVTTENIVSKQIERMLDCFYKSQEYTTKKSYKYNSLRLFRCHCIAEKIKRAVEEGVRYSRHEVAALYGKGFGEYRAAVGIETIRDYEKALTEMSGDERDFEKHSIDLSLVELS